MKKTTTTEQWTSYLAVAQNQPVLYPAFFSFAWHNRELSGWKKKKARATSDTRDSAGLNEVLSDGQRGPFGIWKVGWQLNTGALSAPPARPCIPRVWDCNDGRYSRLPAAPTALTPEGARPFNDIKKKKSMFPKIRCLCTIGPIEKAKSSKAEHVEAASFTVGVKNLAAGEKECLFFVNVAEWGGREEKISRTWAKWAQLTVSHWSFR